MNTISLILDQEGPARLRSRPQAMRVRSCRVCGCTDLNCIQCIQRTGVPCSWAEIDLCTACVGRVPPRRADGRVPRRVQLRRRRGWRKPPNTVVVTRASRMWGNRFVIGRASIYGTVSNAATAVKFFRRWLTTTAAGKAVLMEARRQLRGRNLACFCGLDQACHADVLLELAN
jgi:Domain of unknown function (DUF4326)